MRIVYIIIAGQILEKCRPTRRLALELVGKSGPASP
jgi:hypothetical protein